MRDNIVFTVGFIAFVFAGVVGLLLFAGAAVSLQNKVQAPAEVARIEQLRKDVASLKVSANAEDVIGQVTETNQTLARAKAFNARWYTDLWVPDEIAETAFIELGEAK